MNIPNYIPEKVITKDGDFTAGWMIVIQNLLQELQNNVGNNGFVIPSLTFAQISQLTNSVNGTMIYDTTNNVLRVNIGGTFKIIQTI